MTDLPTSIPAQAREVIHETWERGAKKSAYYTLDEQQVGYRSWSETDQLTMEYGIRDDRMHGLFRTWHDNGQLCEVSWYEHGKEHGTTKQYDIDGTLIGTYTMVHGTGIDLWFERQGILAEERHCRDGLRHGYERWWNEDNATVWQESHYWHGLEHGIFRQWNQAGRLRRGYPRYVVAGHRVTKRQYERACRHDSTLPRIIADENIPARAMPPEVEQAVKTSQSSLAGH